MKILHVGMRQGAFELFNKHGDDVGIVRKVRMGSHSVQNAFGRHTFCCWRAVAAGQLTWIADSMRRQ